MLAGKQRAAAYVRQFGIQWGGKYPSVAEQRERLEAHIADQGWELAGVWEDAADTTGTRGLAGLASLWENLDRIDKLVIPRLEWIARSARRVDQILNKFRDMGVDLVCLEEAFDTGTPDGQLVSRLFTTVARWEPPPEWAEPYGWDPENLRNFGFAPATLIDVGVAEGTPTLYQAFPDAYLVLIEPLSEFEHHLEELIAHYRGEYLLTAVGAREETVTMNVDRSLAMSTILAPAQPRRFLERREIPTTTLEKLVGERRWSPPFGLKIDVEGFEHHVIEGAGELLEETEFVIAEMSISRRFEESCPAKEFIALMASRGFELCDLIDAFKGRHGSIADGLFRRRS